MRGESVASVESRALKFLAWLAEREEQCIAVVSHSSFLRTLFNDVLVVDARDASEWREKFRNCEVREVTLTF